MKREGNNVSIFKIEKIPIFSHDAPKFEFGDGKNVKKWGKKYMEREGKSIHFNKLLCQKPKSLVVYVGET